MSAQGESRLGPSAPPGWEDPSLPKLPVAFQGPDLGPLHFASEVERSHPAHHITQLTQQVGHGGQEKEVNTASQEENQQ